jgi:hypothetical protein
MEAHKKAIARLNLLKNHVAPQFTAGMFLVD